MHNEVLRGKGQYICNFLSNSSVRKHLRRERTKKHIGTTLTTMNLSKEHSGVLFNILEIVAR